MTTDVSGADPALVASQSSQSSLSRPSGFDPGEEVKAPAAWRRYRFRSWSADDPRPITFPPPGPYWVTGYGYEPAIGLDNDREFAILVAYLPGDSADEPEHFWPETDLSEWDGYDFQWREEVAFSARFPKPDWWPR